VAPAHNVETNVLGTLNVLEAVRRHQVDRMVHTSTSECFGSAQYVPMDERHPLVAQSPYAATKVAADQLVGSYVRSFDVPAVTIRPFNTFGPRQSYRAIIPTIVGQALRGSDIRLGSVTPVRDLNPVANTVDAMLRAGEVRGIEGELFVVGSGVGRTVQDVVDEVGRVLDITLSVSVDSRRVRPNGSEVDRLICDYSLARERLGYLPQMTFEDGLRATVAWLQNVHENPSEYAI
jgi:nucleoside-diphosphate-sugar epimerase